MCVMLDSRLTKLAQYAVPEGARARAHTQTHTDTRGWGGDKNLLILVDNKL